MKQLKLFVARHSKSRSIQTMLDQVVVSGSNFATGVLLVRGLGLEEFGKFTIAYAIILLANNLQLSFIASPMLTIGALCTTTNERKRYLRGMFGVQLVFCGIVSVTAAIAALMFLWLSPRFGSVSLIPAFVSGVALFLMQDWLRRYYFGIGKPGASVWNDAISYVGQLVLLAWLFRIHRLTVVSALLSIGVTSGAAFGVGMLLERIRFKAEELREAWHRSKVASRDLAIASQLQWCVYQGAMLIGASVLGPQAAGGVRATQNVVGPVNVAFQAMENIVPIRAGEEMRRGGIQQAAKFLFRFGLVGFVLLLIAFLGIFFFSKSFLSVVYGRQVAVYSGILDLQLLYFLLAWPLRQLTYLFRTIGRTTVILGAAVVAATASLALVYPLVRSFGSLGIMLAAVAGQTGSLLFVSIAWAQTKSSYSNGSQVGATLEPEPPGI